MHRNQTKQALANLSSRPVNDISMARLAPMFAKQVLARREAERRAEFETNVPQIFVDHLKAKAAKLLEKEAENTASTLPISSVFDALQIAQRHKEASSDAGIRAWKSMLQSMWKKDRTANLTAESFMRLRDYFANNFPKSAVSEVFDEIGANGYAALPVSDLVRMASRIHSQEDFEYEMMKAGLITKQPHHVKARNFVLAVVNGEVNPETGFEPEEEMDAADWVVNKIKHQMEGGDPDEYRRKNPPPKRHSNKQAGFVEASRRRGQEGMDADDENDYEEEETIESGDIVISSSPKGHAVGVADGEHIGMFREWDEAEDAIIEYCNKEQFWPNAWFVSDHGNVDHASIDWNKKPRQDQEFDESFDPETTEGVAEGLAQMLEQYDRTWIMDLPKEEFISAFRQSTGFGTGQAQQVYEYLHQQDFDVEASRRAQKSRSFIGNFGDANWIEYGGLLLFDGEYGPYMYVVEPFSIETGEVDEISDPDMKWLVYQVQLDKYNEQNGKLVDDYGREPWFAKDLESITSTVGSSPEEFIQLITSDKPEDLVGAYEMLGAWGGWDEFDYQHYLDASELKDWFSDILEPGDLEFEPDEDEDY